MAASEDLIQLLFHSHGPELLAVAVQHTHAAIQTPAKLEHLLCPVSELRGFNGGAFGVLKHAHDVVVALAGDERFVAFLGRERADIVVEDAVEELGGGEGGGLGGGGAG